MDDWSETAATFGDRLAAAREGQGLSQADLARKLGLKLQTIRNWEDDRAEPRANKLQMVAGFLNVSMVWLMTGIGDGGPEPRTEDGEGTLGPTVKELLAELRELRLGQMRAAERMASLEKRLRHLTGAPI
ncbi:MAG TPA: helix-turn-helix transcriptional regulator [Thermohalobaculum sp.]|nr:helix-turn-helix transcriptional regulator [Thermohalobaculum sp.]